MTTLAVYDNDFGGLVTIKNISEYGAILISGDNLGQPEEKLTVELNLPQIFRKSGIEL